MLEEKNRVTVKIYGQEYTIAGDMPRDHIIKVADYVDEKMQDVAQGLPPGYTSALAVLTAVNVADDYFKLFEKQRELQMKNQDLEKDAQHYVQLWDEAKKSFIQYKDDAQSNLEQKEELQQVLIRQKAEFQEIQDRCKELESRCESLKRRNEDLTRRIQAQDDAGESSAAVLRELESRCKDMEGSFFDLQMENIQLKGELERYKKIVE